MLHKKLWQENKDLAQSCLAHPFVRGLADGSLAREAFKRYIAQDAFFLRAFCRAYALAAVKSQTMDQIQSFWKCMGGVLEELDLHSHYAAKWKIDLTDIQPIPATQAYTDFLTQTAWHKGVDEILAAMVPCMRLYAFLGSELSTSSEAGNPYHDWIETYSSEEFGNLTDELESLLDIVAHDTPRVRYAYRYAITCELDFFSGAMVK